MFVCALLVLPFLGAEEEQEFSLVNYAKSPIPRVAGTVNVITGNWIDQGIDCQTTGPDPYLVGHAYVCSNLDPGSITVGWDFLHPSTLEVYQPAGITYILKSPPDIPEHNNPVEAQVARPSQDPTIQGGPSEVVSCLEYETTSSSPPEIVEPGDKQQLTFVVEKGVRSKKHDNKHPSDPLNKPHKPPQHHTSLGHPYREIDHMHGNDAKLLYREAGGAVFLFKGDVHAKHFEPKIRGSGYTHIASISSPSLRDPRKTRVHWDQDHDEWNVTLGDGTRAFR